MLVEGGDLFVLDIVENAARDTQAPQVTLLAPVGGVTNNRVVSLAGLASDDGLVAAVAWALNGQIQGPLTQLPDGSFSVDNIQLMPGENVLRVVATDLDGNEGTAEVRVTWAPDRHLSSGPQQTLAEGDTVRIPLTLRSTGDVGGMTFEMLYEAAYLKAMAFEAGEVLANAVVTSNVATPGTVFVTFAHGGNTVPSGEQLMGHLVFRGRSVPNDLTTNLDLQIQDVSDAIGGPLQVGNSASGVDLTVLQREFAGDINTNGQLDIGDAFLMQRLLAGLEEKRAWDELLNDLNGTSTVDSGDVIHVMRTVLGFLAQPGTAQLLAPLRARIDAFDATKAFLTIDNALPTPGETVTVTVQLPALSEAISGASFTVDYPAEALRLVDAGSHTAGSLVGGGSFALWNVAPSGNDYTNQTGQIAFAASASSPWVGSETGGEIAVLRFQVQNAVSTQKAWPIQLRAVNVPRDDGYAVDRLNGDRVAVIGQPMSFAQWQANRFLPAELSNPSLVNWNVLRSGGETNGQAYFQGLTGSGGSDPAFAPSLYLQRTGPDVPLIAVVRDLTAIDATVGLQSSSRLGTWNAIDSRVYFREPLFGPSKEIWYIGPDNVDSDWSSFFLRLVFTRVPE